MIFLQQQEKNMTSTNNSDHPKAVEGETLVVNKEDAAMFGNVCTRIGDALQRSVDQSLDAGVATLPLLSKDSSQHLANLLKQSYYINIDTFELYIARNIFSVAMFPPSRRAAVVGLFLDDNADLSSASKPDSCSPNDDDSLLQQLEISRNDIPTEAQMHELQSEIQSLTDRIHQMQTLKANLQKRISEFEMANQLAQTAQQSTAPVIPKLASSVETSFQAAQQLTTILQNEAPRVAQRMHDIKRPRTSSSSSSHHRQPIDLNALVVLPTTTSSLSETNGAEHDQILLAERYRLDTENVVPHAQQLAEIHHKLLVTPPSSSPTSTKKSP